MLSDFLADLGPQRPQFLAAERIRALAATQGRSVKSAMMELLEHDIWPERFRRNYGVLTAAAQARLLQLRIFIAGCGGLGGEVASLLVRAGAGFLRICDSDVFEESNLNRQRFCTEATLGLPKAEVLETGLLAIASYLEVEAHILTLTPENLPALLEGMDVVIDCLDSVARKKMLEQAANGLPYLHGSVLGQDAFVWLAGCEAHLQNLYPDIPAGADSPGPNPVISSTVTGAAALMAALLLNSLPVFCGREGESPIYHLDYTVPELNSFRS